MIIRPDGSDLLLIRQPDHAALAGRIMRAWRADNFPARDTRPRVLDATSRHDLGWTEEDEAPRVNPETGAPYDFVNAPIDTRQGVWPRAVGKLAAADPYVAALVAQHALAVYRRFAGEEAWQEFFKAMEQRRDDLFAQFLESQDLTPQGRILGDINEGQAPAVAPPNGAQTSQPSQTSPASQPSGASHTSQASQPPAAAADAAATPAVAASTVPGPSRITWPRDPAAPAPAGLDTFLQDYVIVGLGDLFSLVFCNGWPEPYLMESYQAILHGDRLTIAPDPFDGASVPLEVEARRIPARLYESDADLQATLANAPTVRLTGVAVGAPLPSIT